MGTSGTFASRKSGMESRAGWISGLDIWTRKPTRSPCRRAASRVRPQTGWRSSRPGRLWTSRQSHRMYSTSTKPSAASDSTACSSACSPLRTARAGPFSSHV
ncbi:MAG: hypothetical protein DMF80_09245 [Acidobacteria bacterium]|nr:MAG: hypothetical protein DMF80_09245 [Acidobacteriota bacterium]